MRSDSIHDLAVCCLLSAVCCLVLGAWYRRLMCCRCTSVRSIRAPTRRQSSTCSPKICPDSWRTTRKPTGSTCSERGDEAGSPPPLSCRRLHMPPGPSPRGQSRLYGDRFTAHCPPAALRSPSRKLPWTQQAAPGRQNRGLWSTSCRPQRPQRRCWKNS